MQPDRAESRPTWIIASACLVAAALAVPRIAHPQPAGSLPPPAAMAAVSPADAFRKMSTDTWVPRVVTFAELGMGPVVLGYADAMREVALPVPPGVPISNATLQLDASFVRADGGRTTLILSLDGLPATARPVTAERGDGSVMLAVDGAPRANGFVKLNVDWRTTIGRDNTCSDTRTPGNLLRIEPTSRLVYRFDAASLQDLPSAWAALPANPTILVMAHRLSADAYDAAWRLGVALERAGKHPKVRVLPGVGDVVDLQGITVPPALKTIPAFAAFAEGNKRRIRDLAEVGALMALGAAGPLQADVVIGDRGARGTIAQALDELRAQLPANAVEAFNEWRERAGDGWNRQLASGQIRVAQVFGRPAIVVASDAGAQAAGLFTLAGASPGSPLLNVAAADDPRADLSSVSLKSLGARPATLDVLSRAEWVANFPMGAVAADGRVPSSLVIDVSASPGAARTPPVASVFLNDVLLAARELEANGRRERLVAPIPRHALGASNTIKVAFVRQQASDKCREAPEPYPVSVLASSHMTLDTAEPGQDFAGLVTRFAGGANLLVPVAYLQDAGATLPRVISLAASTGVSPALAKFTPVGDGGPHIMKGSFLAFDVALKDVDSEVRVEAGRLQLAAGSGRPLMDVSGVHRPGLLEVVQQGKATGAVYRTLGRDAPLLDRAVLLTQGNVAVLGSNGLRAEINTWDPNGQALVGESRTSLTARSGKAWPLWLLAIAVPAGFSAWGWRAWRRKNAPNA